VPVMIVMLFVLVYFMTIWLHQLIHMVDVASFFTSY
jgi:hypothetical protein